MLKQKVFRSDLRIFKSWKTYRGFMKAQNHTEALAFLKTKTSVSSADESERSLISNPAVMRIKRTHFIVQNLFLTLIVILSLMWLIGVTFNVILLVEVFTNKLPWGLSPVFVSGVAVIWFWLPTLTLPKLVKYGIKGEDDFWERYDSIISPDLNG